MSNLNRYAQVTGPSFQIRSGVVLLILQTLAFSGPTARNRYNAGVKLLNIGSAGQRVEAFPHG
jgi:hypothetical protein